MQVFWPRIVLKKWLNLKSKDLDFGADDDEEDDEEDDGSSDVDGQGIRLAEISSSSPRRISLLAVPSLPAPSSLQFALPENCGCDDDRGGSARRPAEDGAHITGKVNYLISIY